MKSFFKVSLQTKILGLILSLILFVILSLTAIFAYLESRGTEMQMKQLALQTAKTISFMPTVKKAFHQQNPSGEIQPIAQKVGDQVGADVVVVANRDGVRYTDQPEIGRDAFLKYNYKAIVFGGYYNLETTGELGTVWWGKAPVIGDHGRVIGVVSVGFLKDKIQSSIYHAIVKISLFSSIVLLLGIGGGILLTKSIRKDTLGLEPHEIASLFRERSAILKSVKEGIAAIDEKGLVTMMNASARNMLGLSEDCIHRPIQEVLPHSKMLRVLETGQTENDQELVIHDRVLIVNRMPILEKGRTVGVVSSFRDKTEIKEMVNTLSEVRKYSEDLRAQTHEFTNKLYVLSGLLQLGRYEEAIEMIQSETERHESQNRILFQQIEDAKVQAVLLGKIGKASEKKVDFIIDSNSSLESLPEHIELSQLVTIIGNLIDNAMEAVGRQENGEISFFATDVGNDVVFEVSDNGSGIPEDRFNVIFEKGFSMKGSKNRGYGLANVKQAVEDLNGMIEVNSPKGGGAIFTVYLPKDLHIPL
ncbi:ATP-binding protein [Paludifilum halophilum]|uniref:histidine kinase n=1 Tax=Paludifilum halophilum TaxID=1642702 RepID=A0A235B6B3_9BACL|nr:sensor histidine kinase [Paludifilum halophilum]OYD07771.1 ATPase [Paludifilum halophilum]